MTVRYLEDFAVGQTFGSGRLRIDRRRIETFAAEFDPQPFHLDEQAARSTLFGGLAASGWHTAAVSMRLLVENELKPAGGIIGAGFDELRWPRPVRPDDELRVESEVLEVRPSQSRPNQGLLKLWMTTLNQNGEAVQVAIGYLLVQRRTDGNPVEYRQSPDIVRYTRSALHRRVRRCASVWPASSASGWPSTRTWSRNQSGPGTSRGSGTSPGGASNRPVMKVRGREAIVGSSSEARTPRKPLLMAKRDSTSCSRAPWYPSCSIRHKGSWGAANANADQSASVVNALLTLEAQIFERVICLYFPRSVGTEANLAMCTIAERLVVRLPAAAQGNTRVFAD